MAPLAPPGIAALTEGLSDESSGVQLAVACALAKHQVKDAIPVLLKTLRHDPTEGADMLRDLDAPTGLPGMPGLQVGTFLGGLVEESAAKDAAKAAAALGEMGAAARDAIPALVEAKRHKRQEVQQAAAEALSRIEAASSEQRHP